ncbi:MAG: hypothetical protein ACI88G_001288 [Woeseiaceae bacterium]|jgi:hypothetical protein
MMETVWIQVFVLTLTQCFAPSGKMVCQEEAVQYQFTNKDDCDHALVQMINVASSADNVIVNKDSSHCRPAAIESMAFNTVDEVNAKFGKTEGWQVLDDENRAADFTQTAHQDRLSNLFECEDVAGVAPCKIGQIIIEASADRPKPEIWQQQK